MPSNEPQPISVYPPTDRWGSHSIPETRTLFHDRQRRKMTKRRLSLRPRPKNGLNDPITYYHLVDTLLTVQPNLLFQSIDLVAMLNAVSPVFLWDTTTVGRILNDIAEAYEELYPDKEGVRFRPLRTNRRWNGMHYFTTNYPEARHLLVDLLEDLGRLSEAQLEQIGRGEMPQRLNSPLLECPSAHP